MKYLNTINVKNKHKHVNQTPFDHSLVRTVSGRQQWLQTVGDLTSFSGDPYNVWDTGSAWHGFRGGILDPYPGSLDMV